MIREKQLLKSKNGTIYQVKRIIPTDRGIQIELDDTTGVTMIIESKYLKDYEELN